MFGLVLAAPVNRSSFDRNEIYIFGNLIFHFDRHPRGSPPDPSVGMGNELAALSSQPELK